MLSGPREVPVAADPPYSMVCHEGLLVKGHEAVGSAFQGIRNPWGSIGRNWRTEGEHFLVSQLL